MDFLCELCYDARIHEHQETYFDTLLHLDGFSL